MNVDAALAMLGTDRSGRAKAMPTEADFMTFHQRWRTENTGRPARSLLAIRVFMLSSAPQGYRELPDVML
jgi:hypothetical protein